MGFGWTADERLVCVERSGDAYVYDIHGRLVDQFSFGDLAASEGMTSWRAFLFLYWTVLTT